MEDVEEGDPLFWDDEEDIEEDLQPVDVERDLERFRSQWRKELQRDVRLRTTEAGLARNKTEMPERAQEPSIEEQAKYLFLQGVNSEQEGKLYDGKLYSIYHHLTAIKYYRRAVQLVPDIEGKIDDYKPRGRKNRQDSESSVGSASSDVDMEDLVQHFTNLQANDNLTICEPNMETNMPYTTGHVSQLPVEIMMYIFKWVVSSELDFLSLVRLSEVCRGFFVVAQDEELWKLICQRVFGRNCGRPGAYRTYRNMYIERPHVRLNGCYISRLEYFRQGEQSLDGLYRPYHLVEYFRYVRFFPDGHLVMLTSPGLPHAVVTRLRSKNAVVQGILYGYYKITGEQVTALLKRRKTPEPTSYYYRKTRRRHENATDGEQSFHVEFSLKPAGRRMCSQLIWKHYSIHTLYRSTGQEQVANFELKNNTYPSLIFSRVKSYTAKSDTPLM